MKNKRGISANTIDIMALFLFVIVIIVFFAIFSLDANNAESINAAKIVLDQDRILLSVLNSPLDDTYTLADYLVYSNSNDEYRGIAIKYLNDLVDSDKYFSNKLFEIIWSDGSEIINSRSTMGANLTSTIELPTYKTENVIIKFYTIAENGKLK